LGRTAPRRRRRRRDAERELLRSCCCSAVSRSDCAEAYAIGKIGGFCHLYIGQEAVSTGSLSLLRPDDYVITTYRDHGQRWRADHAACGQWRSCSGRIDGCARGKGGSMHMFDRNLNFLGGHGIVGGTCRSPAGVGFAIKYRGGDQVIICFMGESVVNTGAFHEALNMAALWKLPCVFLIENNRYGMGTALERASAIHDIHERGAAYNMHRTFCDGQDVFAVRQTVGEAVERARREQQPTLIDVRTYRFMGHSMSDAVSGTYRSKAELDEYLKRDPIALLRGTCRSRADHRRRACTRSTTRSRRSCRTRGTSPTRAPEPPLEALYEDVSSTPPPDAADRSCQ
jgi:pyruvate dehydrogenase E1 component alpha subunit